MLEIVALVFLSVKTFIWHEETETSSLTKRKQRWCVQGKSLSDELHYGFLLYLPYNDPPFQDILLKEADYMYIYLVKEANIWLPFLVTDDSSFSTTVVLDNTLSKPNSFPNSLP
jgi:hypothetical protein